MNKETINTSKPKLIKRKWFQWTIGVASAASLTLAIILPITLLGGGKKSFGSSEEAWSVQLSSVPEGTPIDGWFLTFKDPLNDRATVITEKLSSNTLYYGWYSTNDYRSETEFIEFQTTSNDRIHASIAYSLEIINNAPKLDDDASIEEINAFEDEVNIYLDGTSPNDRFFNEMWASGGVIPELKNTKYFADIGLMTISLYEYDGYYNISSFYKGTIKITQEQIDSGENLPEIYKFEAELFTEASKLYKAYLEWTYENVSGLISEEEFNNIPNLDFTFEQYEKTLDVFDEIISEFSIENVVS